MLIQQARK